MISTTKWMPADGLELEPNALAAIKETARNTGLTAGPGAGKTEMLAQRADFLLRTGSCLYPKRILAISFKVDASQNLKARVKKRCGAELATRFDSYTFHAFAKRILDRFRPVLRGSDALDPDYEVGAERIYKKSIAFADMIPLATTIVDSSSIARVAISQTYTHVFLDEFQDCTRAQYKLIRSCFLGTNATLTAVGDTKQRIMGWAGALEGIFRTYAGDFNALPLNLYQNFRSKPRLRRMQNAMVRVMDPAAAVEAAKLDGEEGEIEILRSQNDGDEALKIAKAICDWIENDGVNPSEIAVLVSKQQSLYCQKLRSALEKRGVPVREEDLAQDLAAEPVARLIVDFLLVVTSASQREAYRRLLDLVVFNHHSDEEREYQARARWDRFVADVAQRLQRGDIVLCNKEDLRELVDALILCVGRAVVVALSFEYARGNRLQELVESTTKRLHELLQCGNDAAEALGSFSGDRAVRIMSIHKSKGLEFNTVVLLGVEKETFWGDIEAERAAYFVGISRARDRLLLTACKYRERPRGAKRWSRERNEHEEFMGYAESYV